MVDEATGAVPINNELLKVHSQACFFFFWISASLLGGFGSFSCRILQISMVGIVGDSIFPVEERYFFSSIR